MKKLAFTIMFLFAATTLLASEKRYDVVPGSPERGPANAPVTIIEFLDFQ